MAGSQKKAPKFKIPAKLAEVADLLFKTRVERLNKSKALEPLKFQEAALRDHLINKLPISNASGIAGKLCRATITSTPEPTVDNWPKLYAYIHKHKAFHLLGKSLNKEAVRELMEGGEKVPGIKIFQAKSVSLNKL